MPITNVIPRAKFKPAFAGLSSHNTTGSHMIPAPTVLVLNARPAQVLQHHVSQLQSHGYTVIVCTDLQALCQSAAQYLGQFNTPWAIMLASSFVDNCVAARRLRGLFPAVGILALVTSGKEGLLTHALRSGADNCCRYSASAALLMATLHPLLARAAAAGLSVFPAAHVASMPEAPEYWALVERGWVLIGPQQQRIRLTTGERALLSTLVAAPGLRVSHGRLLIAINCSYPGSRRPYHHARLTLLVSRLRRKLRAQGCEAPFKSVHRWGYMLTHLVHDRS